MTFKNPMNPKKWTYHLGTVCRRLKMIYYCLLKVGTLSMDVDKTQMPSEHEIQRG
jgi:hypothetical protein